MANGVPPTNLPTDDQGNATTNQPKRDFKPSQDRLQTFRSQMNKINQGQNQPNQPIQPTPPAPPKPQTPPQPQPTTPPQAPKPSIPQPQKPTPPKPVPPQITSQPAMKKPDLPPQKSANDENPEQYQGPSIEQVEKKNLAVKIIIIIVVVAALAGLVLGGVFAYNKWLKPSTKTNINANLNTNQQIIPENIIVNEKIKITDSDGDTITDEWEIKYGLDPNDPADALKDLDKDKLTNKEEFKYKTNPNSQDSDGDTFSDYVEIQKGFNPNGTGKLK